ncbi:vicilin-like antimicrobial peptide 2-2 [Gracilaria domingensis]|nr:vicilin-like antimicrobial peptide 2-2 [Gracilaria domingensis]
MELAQVFHNKDGYSTKIKALTTILNQNETVNSILMNTVSPPGANVGAYTVRNLQPRVLMDAGQPAQWLTHGEELRLRREKEREALQQQKEKAAEQSKKAEERERFGLQAQEAAAERKRKREEEQRVREQEQKKRRLEAVRRRLQRQSAAERKRKETDARKFAQALGRKVALGVRERMKQTGGSSSGKTKVSIRSYQFAALLVVGVVDLASEAGLEDVGGPN